MNIDKKMAGYCLIVGPIMALVSFFIQPGGILALVTILNHLILHSEKVADNSALAYNNWNTCDNGATQTTLWYSFLCKQRHAEWRW